MSHWNKCLLFTIVCLQFLSACQARSTSQHLKKFLYSPKRLKLNPSITELEREVDVASIFVLAPPKYKPVILIHGLNDKPDSLQFMIDTIQKEHGGTEVHYIDILHGKLSLTPLWAQIALYYDEILPIMEKASDGVIMIGYSQGGLIARGIIESRLHNVRTFISLSSPLAGQYGDLFINIGPIPKYIAKKDAYYLLYSVIGQVTSVGNFWNDPYHQHLYYNYSTFLPGIDNMLPGQYNFLYKENFSKLNRLVLIGGPDDGVISPWQSSHFSFYGKNDSEIIGFKHREIFTQNTFGLKTLYDANKVTIYSVPHVNHFMWHSSLEVMEKYVLPWLD